MNPVNSECFYESRKAEDSIRITFEYTNLVDKHGGILPLSFVIIKFITKPAVVMSNHETTQGKYCVEVISNNQFSP